MDDSREALAAILRPGNAGASTAADHIELIALALEQLPGEVVTDAEIVVRTDSAGATHAFCADLREADLRFVLGYELSRGGPGGDPRRWARTRGGRRSARTATPRDGAGVAELTSRLELAGWPEGTRVIVRRERPHPGAQLSFTDHDGHRFLATLTDLPGDPVALECLHRARASAEDRMRTAKQTGMENLPFRDFEHNAVWLELSLIAQDLTAWTQRLALTGELAVCEPKTAALRARTPSGAQVRRSPGERPAGWGGRGSGVIACRGPPGSSGGLATSCVSNLPLDPA